MSLTRVFGQKLATEKDTKNDKNQNIFWSIEHVFLLILKLIRECSLYSDWIGVMEPTQTIHTEEAQNDSITVTGRTL